MRTFFFFFGLLMARLCEITRVLADNKANDKKIYQFIHMQKFYIHSRWPNYDEQ